MRKRSRYRPKPVMLDPVGYVVAGLQPIAAADKELTLLGLKNDGAVAEIIAGRATRAQIGFLINAFNIAIALAHMGQGKDWLPELTAGQEALKAAAARPKFLFTGPELTAVNTALVVHDAQMADPKTTVQMLEQATEGLKKIERAGGAVRLNLRQESLQPTKA